MHSMCCRSMWCCSATHWFFLPYTENIISSCLYRRIAFDNLKKLTPPVTRKIARLRARWGGKRRAKRRRNLQAAQHQEWDDDIPLPVGTQLSFCFHARLQGWLKGVLVLCTEAGVVWLTIQYGTLLFLFYLDLRTHFFHFMA